MSRQTSQTLIVDDTPVTVSVVADGDGLWLSAAETHRVSGWETTPEGACQGARCVRLSPSRLREILVHASEV
jgi:hypothetical protein